MHLLIAVNNFAFLQSHRRPIVDAALERGWRVSIVAPPPEGDRARRASAVLASTGATLIQVAFSRSGVGPIEMFNTVRSLVRVFGAVQPDIVHLVTPKIVICGGIAAQIARCNAVVSAISGLGYLFSGTGVRGAAARTAARGLYSIALRHKRHVIVVQNSRDRAELSRIVGAGTPVVLVHGSGVNLDRFVSSPIPEGIPRVLLPSRMLKDKGVAEFIEAGRILRDRGVAVTMALCGEPDPGNPQSMTADQIAAAAASGAVESAGFLEDMPAALQQASLVCLPSYYGEGLPLALAEATAAGRPIITTDTPGCRDTVIDGVSGRLVPARNAIALADAIESLANDRQALARMGVASRALAVSRFDVRLVVSQHLAIYDSLTSGSGHGEPPE